jgi:hypothetical protein
VQGHPFFKILTLDDLKQELRDFMRAHFISKITDENRADLQEAWEKLCVDGISDPILDSLNVDLSEQHRFRSYLETKYTRQFTENPNLRAYILNSCAITTNFPSHVARFAYVTDFGRLLDSSERCDLEIK